MALSARNPHAKPKTASSPRHAALLFLPRTLSTPSSTCVIHFDSNVWSSPSEMPSNLSLLCTTTAAHSNTACVPTPMAGYHRAMWRSSMWRSFRHRRSGGGGSLLLTSSCQTIKLVRSFLGANVIARFADILVWPVESYIVFTSMEAAKNATEPSAKICPELSNHGTSHYFPAYVGFD